MIDIIIELAGWVISVSVLHEGTAKLCSNYTSDALTNFNIILTQKDIKHEQEVSVRENVFEGLPVREYSDAYLESIAIQRKITEAFFEYDILLFHGSVVAVDGQAYLFTAKSGTGKSTHTRFWREVFGEKAVMVNDDKPFLEIRPEGVTVWGSPWMGKHRLGANIGVPLKAICILERGAENSICPISAQEALPMLFQQSARPRNPGLMGKYMELVDRLAAGVEFYRMKCTMSPEAARMAYEAMKP